MQLRVECVWGEFSNVITWTEKLWTMKNLLRLCAGSCAEVFYQPVSQIQVSQSFILLSVFYQSDGRRQRSISEPGYTKLDWLIGCFHTALLESLQATLNMFCSCLWLVVLIPQRLVRIHCFYLGWLSSSLTIVSPFSLLHTSTHTQPHTGVSHGLPL